MPKKEKYIPNFKKNIQTVASLLFIMYFAFLQYRLFFFAYGQYYRFRNNEISYNLIPFKTIHGYIVTFNKNGLDIWFFNLFGNVLAFIPMGLLLPLITEKARGFKRIIIVTLATSITIEIVQLWLKLGIADIDDVILNTLGGLIGYFLFASIQDMIKKKNLSGG